MREELHDVEQVAGMLLVYRSDQLAAAIHALDAPGIVLLKQLESRGVDHLHANRLWPNSSKRGLHSNKPKSQE